MSPRLLVSCGLLLLASAAHAQGEPSADALAKQLSNPVADLASVPFQLNWENGVGPSDDLRFVFNSQPVVITLTLQSESTYNWEAESGEEWTVPINVIVSKVTKLGPFPFSVAGGAGYYVESPSIGPDWKLRTVFTVILPAKKS